MAQQPRRSTSRSPRPVLRLYQPRDESLLKRPDKKFVAEAAYDAPVFIEDLVPKVAQKVKSHPKITWFRVEAENVEALHIQYP
ncbi:MAG: hypothetical protein RIS79_833 [Verrucomicrobiota bacterium]|jgi:molybdopterin-guanine dinucleotide biosynthesis protein A